MMRRLRIGAHPSPGFTLVELIMVIVVTGILAAVVGPMIGGKYQAVSDSQQRAEWVQQAEFALFHIRQDLHRSVPNSVRIRESDQVMEFLALGSGQQQPAHRYRNKNNPGFDRLKPNKDDAFDVFGVLSLDLPAGAYVSIAGSDADTIFSDWNSEQGGGENGSIARIADLTARTTCDCGDCGQCPVTLVEFENNDHRFPDDSPHLRAYFTDGPVGYQCAGGRLNRHSGYTDLASTNIDTRTGSATTSRVVDDLVSCRFDWQPGFPYRPPAVTVSLSIGDGGETVRLVDSIVLGNGL